MIMNKAVLIGLLVLSFPVFSQNPAWTNFEARSTKYPTESYLIGFSSEVLQAGQSAEQLLKRLSTYAKNQLVEGIMTEIKAVSTFNLNNINGNSNEEFKMMSSSSSHATIAGLKVETYLEQKKKETVGYAFAYAQKSEVLTYYENEIKIFLETVNTQSKIAANFLKKGKNEAALKVLYKIQTKFRETEHAQAIITTLTGNINRDSHLGTY